MRRVPKGVLVVAVLALLFFTASSASGAIKTFSIAGNFSTPANWGGTLPVAGDDLVITANCTFDAGANNLAYGTLTIGNAAARTLSWPAAGTNVLNVSNVSSGFAGSALNMTNGGKLIIRGTWTSTDLTFTPGVAGTTGAIEIQSSMTLPAAYTVYNNLIINGAATTVTLGATFTANSSLAITSGTLNLSTFTANRTAAGGTLTISGGAALKIGGTNTFPTNYTAHSVAVTSTVEYSGTTQSVAVLNSAQDYGNLIISGSLTKTLAGAENVDGDLTIAAGTFSANNFDILASGNWINNGSFTAGTGRVTFTGAGINTVTGSSTTAFNTITINKGSDFTDNILDVQSVITMSAGGLTLTNGTFKLSSNSTITPFTINIVGSPYLVPSTAGLWCNGGTMNSPGGGMAWNVQGLIRVSAGTINVGAVLGNYFSPQAGTTIIIDGGDLIMADRLSLSGSDWTFNMTSGTLTVANVGSNTADRPPFNMDQATCSFSMSGGTIIIARRGGSAGQNLGYTNLATSGTGFTGGTLQIGNGSTPAVATIGITSTNAIHNLTVNGGTARPQTSALTVTNTVTISGGTLSANNLDLTIGGDWINDVSTAAFTAGTATVTFNGAAAGGSVGGSFATTFNSLTMNRTNGISLGANITAGGTLTFTSGNITTGSNDLYLSSTGTVSRSSGHVIGNFRKNVATGATSRTFEIGDATNYTPVTVAFASVTTAGDLTASVVAGDHANIGTSTINPSLSVNRNWTLTNSGIVFTNYGATFTFVPTDVDGTANTNAFIVGKYSAGWTYPTVGTKTATTTQTTGLTTFGDFQLGEVPVVTKTWDGGAGTNNWGDANNWNTNGVPISTDDVNLTGANTININVAAVANNITLNNAGLTLTINTGSTLAVSGSLTLTAGTFNMGTNTVSGAGSFTLGSGGNLGIGSTAGITSAGATGNVQVSGTRTFSTAGNYTYNGTVAQVTGNGLPATVNNLTINNAAGVTLSATVAVTSDLTVTSGVFTVGAFSLTVTGTTTVTSTLTITSAIGTKTFGDLTIDGAFNNTAANEALTVNGNFQNNGTFNGGTGRVTFAGAASNTISGTAASTGFGGGITVNKGVSNANVLDVQSVITMNAGGLTLTNGTFKLSSASTITPFTVDITGSPYLIPSNAGLWCNGGTMNSPVGGMSWTVQGLLRVSAGTVNAGNVTGNYFAPFAGFTLLIEGGNLIMADRLSLLASDWTFNMTGGTLTVANAGSNTADRPPFNMDQAGSSFSMSGGTIIIARRGGSAGQNLGYTNLATAGTGFTGGTLQIGNGSTPAASTIGITSTNPIYNLTVNAAASTARPQTSDLTVANTVTISAGTLSANNLDLTIGGDWINNVSTSAFTAGTATVTFSGAAAGGSIGGSFATTFNGLTMNRANGISLGANATAGGTLTFTSGSITTGSNNLYLSSTGTVSRTSGHVIGNFRKNVATGATSRTFEIGDATNYTPVTVAFASVTTAGDLTASVVSGDHANIGTSTINPSLSVNRNWTLTNSGIVFTNYGATFTFVPTDVDGTANTSAFIVGKYSAGWTYPTVGTKTATTTQATGLTAFIDFAIGEMASPVKTWDGGAATNNWGDAANWNTDGVPTSTDDVDLTGANTININVAATANNLTLNNAGLTLTINSGNSLAVSGGVVLTSGTLNMGANTISGAGSFTLSSGANLGIGSTAGITSSGATGNVQVTGTRTFSTGANYTYNGTLAQVTGNGLPATVNNLTINKTAGVALTSGSITLTGNLQLTGGTFNKGTGTTVNIAGNLVFNAGTTFQKGTGTTNFNGTARTITDNTAALQDLGDVTVASTESVSLSTSAKMTTLGGAGTITLNANTLRLLGAGTVLSITNFNASPNSTTEFACAANCDVPTITYHHLTINSSGNTVTLNGAFADTVISGNLLITAGTFSRLGASCGGLGCSAVIAGNITASATAAITSAISQYQFVGTSQNIDLGNPSAQDLGQLVIGSPTTNPTVTLSTDVTAAWGLTVGSSTATTGTLNLNGKTLKICCGNVLVGAGGTIIHNNGTFNIEGNFGPRTITDNTGTQDFGNLLVATAGNTVNLATNLKAQAITVNGGTFGLGTFNLDVGTDAGTGSITGTGTISASAPSTTLLRGTGNIGGGAFTFYSLQLIGNGTTTTFAGDITVNGDFHTGSGTSHTVSTSSNNYSLTVGNQFFATGPPGGANAVFNANGSNVTVHSILWLFSIFDSTRKGTFNANSSTLTTDSSNLFFGTSLVIGTGTFNSESGTVNYASPVAITVTPTAYNNLGLFPAANDLVFTLPGGTTTVNGNLTVGNGTNTGAIITAASNSSTVNVAGNVTIAPNTTLTPHASNPFSVGGNWVNNGGAFTPSTSTVIFNGTGAQSIAGSIATTFNNLTVSGGGTVTSFVNAGVGGDLLLSSGTLNLGSYTADRSSAGGTLTVADGATLKIGGTNTLPSNYSTHSIGATSTIEYGGTNQSLAVLNSAQDYGHLTISGSGTKTLAGNVNFAGTLLFTNGTITTGVNTLYAKATGTVSRVSGHVIGNFKKYVATGATSKTYEIGDATNFTPVTVAFASVTTAGDLTASVISGDHPNIGTSTINAAKSVNRNWTLTNSGIVFTNYDATFTFVAGDVDGGASTSAFIVGKYSGGSWTYPTVGTKTATTTQATGLTAFSDFVIGEIAAVYTISGHIQNGSAVAISGVTLTLSDGQAGTTTTDASGNYSFANLPSGLNYTVTPSLTNYAFSPASLTYTALGADQAAADFTGTDFSGTAPPLSAATSFAVLAGTTVTSTGLTVVSGNIGVAPGTAVTGFPPGVIQNGQIYSGGGSLAGPAQASALTAYNDLVGQGCLPANNLSGKILGVTAGAVTLGPGVYCFDTSAQLTSNLTLDDGGDPDALFIFQIGTTLTTASAAQVLMSSGGRGTNVYWQVGTSATIGTSTIFRGNMIASTSITMTTSASTTGRLFAIDGAVTMDTNNVDAVPAGTPPYISGNVFEDRNYGGGAGRSLTSSSGIARASVRVELFDSGGTYQTFTTTDGSGNYILGTLPAGTYTVRVVNSSVTSSRGGTSLLPVQTFRTNASSGAPADVTDHVGGETPGLADAGNGSTTLAALTTGTTTAQSITSVVLGSSDITGVDFGYSFNVIVNKNDAGQGSLRQFLTNANALSNTGLAQSGLTAGIDNAVFMLADGTARAGLTASYASQFTSGVATVALASSFPTISDPIALDAMLQPGYAGVPMIELNGAGAGGGVSGLTITAGGSIVRGLIINRFTVDGLSLSTTGSNTISNNYIGTNATGTSASANSNAGIKISSSGNTIGGATTAAGNLISGNGKGVIVATGTGNAILSNSIYGNTGIGIDLTDDGATANDGTKSGALANFGMDTPVFTTMTLVGTTLTVTGYVGSAAGQALFAGASVQVFKSDTDSSGFGEGQTFLGTLTTDASGNFSGTVTVSLAVGDKITGTATDASNNTSEFGANATVANPPPVVSHLYSVIPAGEQLPGTDLVYNATFENSGGQPAQAFIVVNPIPAYTDFKLGSPSTVLGTTGMTVTIEFSNDNAATWIYTPVSGGGGALAGYDRTVTHVRWRFTGNLPQTAPNNAGSVTVTTRIQ